MKSIITFLGLVLVSILYAQNFQNAELKMHNGNNLSGLVKSTSIETELIIFKLSNDAEEQKIPLNSIKKIVFNVNDKEYELENIQYAYSEGKKKRFSWMIKVEDGYYGLYTHANFSFSKDGNLILNSPFIVNRTLPSILFFIKKFDSLEAYPFAIYSSSSAYFGLHRGLKISVQQYMSDYPELVQKVNDRKLSTKNILEIVRSYNQFKTKK